jgi:glutaminyl-peptide cyclotransferase
VISPGSWTCRLALALTALGSIGCAGSTDPVSLDEGPARSLDRGQERLQGPYDVEVVAGHPHDPRAYTQGLELHGGRLLESTGGTGTSERRWVDLETGAVEEAVALDDDLFGEGLTVVGDRVIQLTYRSGVALVASIGDLTEVERFSFEGEGWGLCFDGDRLVMSDGSDVLTLRDQVTFEPLATVAVTDGGHPVSLLNELECRGRQVLANRYGSDEIVVVSTTTGVVEATIDAASLRPADLPIENLNFALNGIAHDPATERFYLTGKWWPVLYEVRLVPAVPGGR